MPEKGKIDHGRRLLESLLGPVVGGWYAEARELRPGDDIDPMLWVARFQFVCREACFNLEKPRKKV